MKSAFGFYLIKICIRALYSGNANKHNMEHYPDMEKSNQTILFSLDSLLLFFPIHSISTVGCYISDCY